MSKPDLDSEEELGGFEIDLKDYVIRRLDSNNIIVEEVKVTKDGDNPGTVYRKTISYHNKVLGALEKVLRLKLDKKQIKSISSAITALDEVQAELKTLLEKNYKSFNELKDKFKIKD